MVMAVAARVNPKDYFTPDEWDRLAARSSWKGWALVAHCWLTIVSAAAVAVVWPNPLTILLAIMVIGARQLGLAILMHDAAHFCLHPNPKINDWIGDWLCGVPVGARVGSYRRYHLQHHKYAQQTEDPDLVLSAPFPIRQTSFWRKVVRDLTGQTFFKQRLAVFKSRLTSGATVADALIGEISRQRAFLLWNLGLLMSLSWLGLWWAYLLFWLGPMATWYPLVTRVRNIAEHAMIAKDEPSPLQQARTTRANLLERLFIAPYYVNFHCEHHMFMHVPCWNLPNIHRQLARHPEAQRRLIATGYFSVLNAATGKSVGV